MMTTKTRIAPSPTGFMHIGNIRTAIFSYLYAKKHNGHFCLRIEDTDRERHSEEAVQVIYDSLKWLGLNWDEEVSSQFALKEKHQALADELLSKGKAYKCFSTKEEITAQKESQKGKFASPWRDTSPKDYPTDQPFTIRLKIPTEGEISLTDEIRGNVTVKCSEIEDLIIVRSDGIPTYNLSVVHDDYTMGITHVFRGEDHLTNTFKQIFIYKAMGWKLPHFGHFPLILAPAGHQGKLSKRHGAVAIKDYEKMGFLSEAVFNYLIRLGWSHGDDEIISKKQAIEWFDLKDITKSGARFDLDKAKAINAHYIRECDDKRLTDMVIPFFEKKIERALTDTEKSILLEMMPELKTRVKTLVEMADLGAFLFTTLPMDEKAKKILEKPIPIIDSEDKISPQEALSEFIEAVPNLEWTRDLLNDFFNAHAEKLNVKLGKLLQPLRALICFSTITPPLYEAMVLLGKDECLSRLTSGN